MESDLLNGAFTILAMGLFCDSSNTHEDVGVFAMRFGALYQHIDSQIRCTDPATGEDVTERVREDFRNLTLAYMGLKKRPEEETPDDGFVPAST